MLVLVLVAGVASAPAPARADDPEPERPRHYFYKGYDYGSQALYGPIYVLLNRGFDTLQLRPRQRSIFDQSWSMAAENVADNLASPLSAIEDGGGWGKFARQELLPLSWTTYTARWAPNYSLHLIGGGQTYAALREWYEDHDAGPLVASGLSAATLMTAAFLNETIENQAVRGPNTDAIADLYVFDVAGIVLFSFEPVRRFFSKFVIVSDWSLQPAFTSVRGELHNNGNYYAAKLPLPYADRVRLFVYGGYSTMPGLSYQLTREYSISAAAGWKVATIENGGLQTVENQISTRPTAALFLDRNDSLLASVQVADVTDYFLQTNIYPNAFGKTDPGFGFWSVVARDGRWLAGVSMSRALGFGVGTGRW